MLCSEEYFENKGIEQICKQIDQSLSLEENDVIKDFTSELNIEHKEIGKKKYSIAFLNFGAKDNIKKNFYSRNCEIEEFDMNFKAEDIINKNFDGFFLSNGPGDPKKVYENIKPELNKLLNKKIYKGEPIADILVKSPKKEPEVDLIVDESPGKDVPLQSNNVRNVSINNTKLANLIDLQDPIRTGVIFKEIFDKPKSLRGRLG